MGRFCGLWTSLYEGTNPGFASGGYVGGVELQFRPSAVTRLLVVSDTKASRDWYVNVLEASVYGEYGTSIILDLFGTWVLLVEQGDPTDDKPTVSMIPPEDPDRMSTETIFRVDDCRSAYAILKARGAEFLTPPVDWGAEIRAFFRDPDGHLFEISELA